MVRRPSLRHALAASLRRLRRRAESGLPAGEAGNIMIMMGLATVVLFGIMGLAIDVGRLYATKAELSRAVDAAALAGVLEFDGTPAGLLNAQTRAEAYLVENEPGLDCPGGECYVFADGGQNRLTVDATKSVKMFFLSVFGIDSASVDGHAVAGFNDQTIDAVLVLDSTASMDGTPIQQAKIATENFKNALLGTSPSGNVVVGFTPFRGCFRADDPYEYAPLQDPTSPQNGTSRSSTNCVHQEEQVTYLTSNTALLTSRIGAIDATGGSGTNVANGLLKGWEILDGPNNHVGEPNNQRFLILLSDGDNNYNGSYAYRENSDGDLFDSPHSYNGYSARPPQSCSNVGGEDTSGQDICEDDSRYTGTNGEITDAAPSPSCSSSPAAKRERQLDMRTLTIANAIEAAGVEVFVVAFGVCQNKSTVYTPTQCAVWTSGGSGLIGNTANDNTADQRLLKCVATSTPGTNDHYYYASSASALPAIFQTIAAQIAHRLIE